MKKNSGTTGHAYRFSKIQKQIILLQDGQHYRVKNNKDFVKYFPEEKQQNIQNWLKTHKIKIQKANNESWKQISEYLLSQK
jgi:hypothetical protein